MYVYMLYEFINKIVFKPNTAYKKCLKEICINIFFSFQVPENSQETLGEDEDNEINV